MKAQRADLFAKATRILTSICLALLIPAGCAPQRSKRLTVEMHSQPGGIWPVDVVSLHLKRQSVDCSLNFSERPELELYIKSFGLRTIPVEFDVDYGASGRPSNAFLRRVGNWNAEGLPTNERVLSVSLSTSENLKTNRTEKSELAVPASCFEPIQSSQFSGNTFLLGVSVLNLVLLAAGYSWSRRFPAKSSNANRLAVRSGTATLFFGMISQAIYLILAAAWSYRWISFFPGSPLTTLATLAGLALSVGALISAFLTIGVTRVVGLLVALTTGALWLFALLVSSAV